jgi:hypothetical protein
MKSSPDKNFRRGVLICVCVAASCFILALALNGVFDYLDFTSGKNAKQSENEFGLTDEEKRLREEMEEEGISETDGPWPPYYLSETVSSIYFKVFKYAGKKLLINRYGVDSKEDGKWELILSTEPPPEIARRHSDLPAGCMFSIYVDDKTYRRAARGKDTFDTSVYPVVCYAFAETSSLDYEPYAFLANDASPIDEVYEKYKNKLFDRVPIRNGGFTRKGFWRYVEGFEEWRHG